MYNIYKNSDPIKKNDFSNNISYKLFFIFIGVLFLSFFGTDKFIENNNRKIINYLTSLDAKQTDLFYVENYYFPIW